jgi:hypothetical protein
MLINLIKKKDNGNPNSSSGKGCGLKALLG